MTPRAQALGTAVAVLAASVYLRRSAVIVTGAYRVGRDFERLVADPARYVPAFRVGYKIGRGDWQRSGGGISQP